MEQPRSENLIERAHAVYEAYNTRDWDAFFADFHEEDYEWVPVEEGVAHRGREQVLAYHSRWLEDWAEFVIDVEEIKLNPVGTLIFSALRYDGKVRESDATISGRFFHVTRVVDGKFGRTTEYIDEAQAREAAGLPSNEVSST